MNGPASVRTTLDAALSYAERGCAVFPVCAGHKCPATVNGYKDATTDSNQIEHWFHDKDYNLAIATGLSGLVVIDVDGMVGQATLQELCAGRHWPDTYTVQTRTPDGRHYYFRAPAGRLVRCSAGRLGNGIDVRAQGGYVVAPPSWVEADQKGPAGGYRVLLDVPAVDLPDWLETLLTQPACSTNRPARANPCQKAETPREVAILRDRLTYISADCTYETYRNIVWAILSTGWLCAEQIALEWSLTAPHRFEQDCFNTLVTCFDPLRVDCPTLGTIYYHARLGGWHG